MGKWVRLSVISIVQGACLGAAVGEIAPHLKGYLLPILLLVIAIKAERLL